LDAASDHVWLLDAGHARYVKKTRITRPGWEVVGTEGYRAPESLDGYDYKQSDFYALGLVLFEMLAGRHPFDHRDPDRRPGIPDIRLEIDDCPKYLAYATSFLLSPEVGNRPQAAAEVMDLLEDPNRGLRLMARRQLPWARTGMTPLLFHL